MLDDPLQRFRLDGRVALITGAGRGIGLAMARTLAAVGASVAITDIDLPVAQSEADRINADGGRAIAIGGDVVDPAFAKQAVEQTLEQLGGLHILVNGAAIQFQQHWTEETLEQIEQQLAADLVTPLLLCKQVIPHFQQQRFGRIINMGSVQQKKANPGMMTYSLCKGALEKLTMGLARHLAKDQITVNCIAPGWINMTYRNRVDLSSPERAIERGQHIPVGRLGEPADFDGITLLLCGPAGEYITGQTIFVDGGMSA